MITEEQVYYIKKYVDESLIEDTILKDDLIDHLCCQVETGLQKGQHFDLALEKAIKETCPNGLDEIHHETVYLLNYEKTIKMKKITYLSGFLFSLAMVIGVFFQLMHLPGAKILMFSGGSGLAYILMPLLLIDKFKRRTGNLLPEKLKWIFGALSVTLFMTSALMKINHLQGATIILGLSFIIFGIGFLPFFFFRMYKKSMEQS